MRKLGEMTGDDSILVGLDISIRCLPGESIKWWVEEINKHPSTRLYSNTALPHNEIPLGMCNVERVNQAVEAFQYALKSWCTK